MVKRALAIVVGFVHDLATGCWLATVLATWWLHREALAQDPGNVLQALAARFFWMGLGCILVVLATGAGRSFTYADGVYGEDAEALRRRLLVVKHVVLVIAFATGTWWQYHLAFP